MSQHFLKTAILLTTTVVSVHPKEMPLSILIVSINVQYSLFVISVSAYLASCAQFAGVSSETP